jgi:hypothetical protein
MVHLGRSRQLKLGQLMAQFVRITYFNFNLFLSHISLSFFASPAWANNVKCFTMEDDPVDRGSGRYWV